MKLHPLTLKFSGESSKFEAPFLIDYYRGAFTHVRLALIMAALLYASFAGLDAQRMPEEKYTIIWFIRFAIVIPALLLTLLATFSKYFERYMQPILAGIFILIGVGIIYMMFIDTAHIPYTGLLLVFLWGYTLARIRFLWATLAGWALVASYEIAAIWISQTPSDVLLSNSFFFILANVIGMLACYSIEYYIRRDFLLTQHLELEREKVYKINQELEERVEKRTVDYLIINRELGREIIDRKDAEQALRVSEQKYRLIAENTADLISTMDMNLRFTYVSPASRRLRGFTAEEAMEQTLDQVLTPESLQLGLSLFEKEMQLEASGTADPDRTRILELEEYRKDGSIILMEVSLSFLRDEEGKPVEILMVSRDITARKQAEEVQRSAEERLQHADKMEAIGTLAGGIAHDFNNLLMGIQGYASLSLMSIDQSNPNYERLKKIEEQVQSGADLTNQLLGFARGGRYEVKPTDMNEIIQKTSSMFGRTKKEISLHRKQDKDLWNVEVDRGQMEQVFLNLYVNAWQAMPGGGEIYLETQNVFLNDEQALLCSTKPGKHVKITITDTGTGMDEKTKERIFDPFFTTKEMGRGTGLGLATVYGIIKGHQGVINVYSEQGHGTTFTIYLPASEKEIGRETTEAGHIVRGTETILLVDDEKTVLEVNKELLEYLGYRVYAVYGGQEAIAIYMEKGSEIDLVILDMIMPGISGGKTFDRLRAINPEVKVLLSSGYSLNGEAKHIMDRGCQGFLQKPVQLEKLSRKVRELLE